MKQIFSILLSLMMLCALCLPGLAEGTQPPAMPDGGMPNGFGNSDGSQGGMPDGFGNSDGGQRGMPDGFGNSDGGQGGMPDGFGNSDGGQNAFPDGMTPPAGGFDGGFGGFGGFGGQQVEGQLGSWGSGGTNAGSIEGDDYAYDAALFVTADGIDTGKSAAERIIGGTFDNNSISEAVINDETSGHNGIIVVNADYTISGVTIEMLTDADGTDTCDFSGKGTAVAVYGQDAHVVLEDSSVHTAGVAAMPIFADGGGTLTVKNSVLRSDGGTLYKEYLSTPDQKLMVAPPWILGIMGTSRCLNLMGTGTTTNVIDSETSAGAWAVLSTDAGTDMYLNVYNSSLTLNNADESQHPLQAEGGQITETLDNPYTVNYGSGYGSFVIGSAVETFVGAELHVGTYAAIFNGGTATYTALTAGESYELKNSIGEITAVYEAKEDKKTEIHSDTFGFMAMQNQNKLTLEKGTVLESGYTSFLVKTGYGGEALTAVIDDADIRNGGVLIQLMDNDDATNGGMMAANDPANTNGGMQNFIPFHSEESGFHTSTAIKDSAVQTFAFTNGEYSGNIYNASGSDGLNGNALNVNFGAGAVYSGAIASTAAIHVTCDGASQIREDGGFAFDDPEAAAAFAEKYQNTYFTINEYWSIGHVANLVNRNGANTISITLTDDAVWNVTGTSVISSLKLEGNAKVIVPAGVSLSVGNSEYTDCELTAASFY